MANETTGTTLNDLVYSAIISPAIMATLSEHALPLTWCREYNLVGQPANAVDVPYFDSDFGSANDRGAGVDTEYAATEGAALSNTELSTSKFTLTAAEFGILYEVTQTAQEDSISGVDLFGVINDFMARALALAISDDFCALFTGLSNSVGTTNTAPTIANFLSAVAGIRTRGTVAPGGLVSVLDNQHVIYLETEITGTAASTATYLMAGDRLLGIDAGDNNGLDMSRLCFALRGYPCIATGLTDTANAGVDAVSAVFTPAGGGNDPYATFGLIIKRLPQIRTDVDITKRTDKLAMTMRMGVGELHDGTGAKIVAKAT